MIIYQIKNEFHLNKLKYVSVYGRIHAFVHLAGLPTLSKLSSVSMVVFFFFLLFNVVLFFSLDPELKSELVTIIQKLLADKTVLVIGSAVMAFTEVCPERVDLIHQVYRKLCALLVDVDEWGQVTIVNMLTRYARSQFADPNLHVS